MLIQVLICGRLVITKRKKSTGTTNSTLEAVYNNSVVNSVIVSMVSGARGRELLMFLVPNKAPLL